IGNTILAANVGGTSPDFSGSFTSLGHNLIGKASGSTFINGVNGDLVGTAVSPLDPQLGPLQDNGGGTTTHALLTGSPAIDAGNNTGVAATDQRGQPRRLDGNGDGIIAADMGAFEAVSRRFDVNSVLDTVDANTANDIAADAAGRATLRAAVMQANTTTGADTIFLPAGRYPLTLAGTGENSAATGDLDVTESLTIVGAGAAVTTIDAGALDRVFQTLAGVRLNLIGVTVTGGAAPGGEDGGAILSAGPLLVENSILSGNSAGRHGGGILGSGIVTITGSTLSNNMSGVDGGGLYGNAVVVAVSNSSFTSNSAGQDGGGIFNNGGAVSITDSQLDQNTAPAHSGGGVFNAGAGSTLAILRSRFTTNTAPFNGGGLAVATGTVTITASTFSGGLADQGGGVFNNDGHVTITSSTFSGNQAVSNGGGLFNDLASARATISNSTFSGNSSVGAGAIANNAGQVTIASSTVTANSTTGTSAGGVLNTSGTVTVSNSVVAGTAANKPDVQGVFSSGGHNLIGNVGPATGFTHGTNGDLVGGGGNPVIDAKLGPLTDSGGPTFTHLPLAGSPVIDAGGSTSLTFDQRGSPREWDGDTNGTATADIGAVEYLQGFFVDSFEDTVDKVPGDGVVADANGKRTLRAAIMEANAKAGADTIVLAAGTYTLTISGNGEDAAARGDLDVTSGSLTIVGAGMGTTVIDAGGAFGIQDRVFHVPSSAATLRLENLTVTRGISGGGVYVAGGALTLLQTEVTDNEGWDGGGICLSGTASITNSVISGNRSVHHGGGLYFSGGNATLANSTIADNTATLGGGGIFSYGTLTIAGSTIAG
ncbi:MAG: hypothetical protein NTY19_22150, partial [Planctomycetota bacterium]|nr:hypothetical protein [Planctomycetota bacterium]